MTYYHPTFLYESVWNLIGFIGLHFFSKKRKFDGEVFLLYVAWYGLGRVWIEGLRTDSLYIGATGIRVSQALSAALAAAALAVLIIQARRPHPPEALYVNRVSAAKAAEDEKPEDEKERSNSIDGGN